MVRLTKDQKNRIITMALNNSKPVKEFAKLIQETSPKIAAIVESYFPTQTCKLENKRIKDKFESLNKDLNIYNTKSYLPYETTNHVQLRLPQDSVFFTVNAYYLNSVNPSSFPFNERSLSNHCSNGYFNSLLDLNIIVYSPSRALRFSGTSEVSKIFLVFANKYLDLNKEFEEVKALVTSTINSVTTINKLLEVWPESKDIIPQSVLDEHSSTTKTLVVPTFKLNKALGLPKT